MSAPRSSRRDFLKGRAALRAAEEIANQAVDALASSLPPTTPNHYLLRFSRRAMACEFEFWLNAGEYDHGPETALAALDVIEQLEDQLTVYRDHSEVSLFNRRAVSEPVIVEDRLFELINQAVSLWRLTDGAFDITAGPLSELWGFKRREGRLPEEAAIKSALARVGSQHLLLDAVDRTIRFAHEGIQINLGGIGKGYALDRCTETFAAAGIENYLCHGGSSSVLARGKNAARPDGGWSVGVRNPLEPEQYLGEIILCDKALSTSSTSAQYFIHEGKRYGHILDPRTGWPAEGILAVTAIAPTAAEAEALSTAFFVAGVAVAKQLCTNNPTYSCLILCPGNAGTSIESHRFNMESIWQPAG